MKKETINLILGGVGVVVALIALSPKGEGKDGSESGGFQLPSIFPAGSGAGEAAPAGSNTYNISFPSFPGFPTGETKKSEYTQTQLAKQNEVAYSGFKTQNVPTIANFTPTIAPVADLKKSGGSKSTYAPSGGYVLGKSYKLSGSTTGMTKSYSKKSSGFGGKW